MTEALPLHGQVSPARKRLALRLCLGLGGLAVVGLGVVVAQAFIDPLRPLPDTVQVVSAAWVPGSPTYRIIVRPTRRDGWVSRRSVGTRRGFKPRYPRV
jgi:hypothetical protein